MAIAQRRQLEDLNEYLYERKRQGDPLRKLDLARLLSKMTGRPIHSWTVTALLDPERYRPNPTDDLIAAIAQLLKRDRAAVREFYDRFVRPQAQPQRAKVSP